MSNTRVPVVVSEDGTHHEPMAQGDVMPVSSIPLSTSKQNLLNEDATGILLTGNDVVSSLEHNPIVVNVDGKLYFRANAMLSPEDKVIKVSDNLVKADLTLDFDAATSTLTLRGKDKLVISEHVLPIISGVPTEMEVLQNYTPPKPAGFVENPYKKSTYLHIRYQAAGDKEVDTYVDLAKLLVTGGNGITVKDNVVAVDILKDGGLKFGQSVTCSSPDCACQCMTPLAVDMPTVAQAIIDPKDRVLAYDSEGEVIKTTLKLEYDADKKILSLLGKNDVPIGEAALKLPDIPGLPSRAEFVDDPVGYPAGKYLYLQFTLDSGQVKDLYLNVSPLVDVFTGGDGIDITGNVVSADTDQTLRIVDEKLGVNTPRIVGVDDPMLFVASNRIGTRLDATFTAGTLYLTGVNGAPVAEVAIPIDGGIRPTGADWLKDYTPQGGTTGTYLRIHFNEDSGYPDFLINFDPIVAAWGNGLVEEDNTVKVSLLENGPFKFTSKGELDIELPNITSKETDNILKVSEVDGKLYVKDSGLSADKLGAGLDIGKSTGNLILRPAEIIGSGLTLDPNSGKVVVESFAIAGLGLQVDAQGKLTTKLEDVIGRGLAINKDTGKLVADAKDIAGMGLDTDKDGALVVALRDIVSTATGLAVDENGKLGIDLDALAELISSKIKAPVSAEAGNILKNSTADGRPLLPGDLGSLS